MVRRLPTQRELLEALAEWQPERPAFILYEENRTVSYGEFDQNVNRLANGLRDRGIRPEDKVLFVLDNTIEFPLVLYACHKLGAIPAPVSTKLSVDHYEYLLRLVNPRSVVVASEIIEQVEEAVSNLTRDCDLISVGEGLPNSIGVEALIETGSSRPPPEIHPKGDEFSYLIFTSGTTGYSKGAKHTEWTARERGLLTNLCAEMNPETVTLGLVPWFHGLGIDVTLRSTIMIGGTQVILADPQPRQVLEAIEQCGVTHVVSVPTITDRIANHPTVEDTDLSSIEYWLHSGAVLSERQIKKFIDRLTPNIYNMYGSVEAGIITQLNPSDHPEGFGSVGRPVDGSQVRIIEVSPDPDTRIDPDQTVPHGTSGEIIVRTSHLCQGYFDDVPQSRDAFNKNWFYTNDLGVIDQHGYLRVLGRADHMINSGGELISPFKVEEVLEEHPAVTHAVVVGAPHDEMGHQVKAYVELNSEASEGDLDAFCQQSTVLPDFERPRAYQFVDEIPLSTHGKKKRTQFKDHPSTE